MSERDRRAVSPNGIEPRPAPPMSRPQDQLGALGQHPRESSGPGAGWGRRGGTSTGGPSIESIVSTAWIRSVSGE